MYTLNLEIYTGSQTEGPFQYSNSAGEQSSQFAFHKNCTMILCDPKKKKMCLFLPQFIHIGNGIVNNTGKPMMVTMWYSRR